jgi:hypothetical protein
MELDDAGWLFRAISIPSAADAKLDTYWRITKRQNQNRIRNERSNHQGHYQSYWGAQSPPGRFVRHQQFSGTNLLKENGRRFGCRLKTHNAAVLISSIARQALAGFSADWKELNLKQLISSVKGIVLEEVANGRQSTTTTICCAKLREYATTT